MLKAIIKKAQSFNHSTKLILLVVQFLTGPPAYAAATYTFPGNLPATCTTISTGIYTCEAITLNAYDKIVISSPSTITVNTTLIADIFSEINSGESPPTLNLLVKAAIGIGANSILNANVISHAAINIGAGSAGKGSIATAIGAVTLGAGVKFVGDITTGTGAITVGAGSVLDNLKTTDVGAITVGASATIGSITTNTGAVNLGAGSTVARSISTGPGAGTVTLGANVNIAGSVTTVIGTVNVGADSIICGDISTKTGVITVGARVQVGGDVTSRENAITIGANSKIGGNVITPGVKTLGADVEVMSSNVTECAGKKINICENNVDKKIDAVTFKNTPESSSHYLGQCNAPVCGTPAASISGSKTCTPPLPVKADILPNTPENLVNEFIPVTGLIYCSDGGVKSDSSVSDATIKRANIVNSSTENGTFEANALVGAKIKYGVKAGGVLDISNATQVRQGQWTGVTLTDMVLDDVYIDTATDYIDENGSVKDGTYIKVTGGKTSSGTITSGMITAGKDASANPIRGSITSGLYLGSIDNVGTVITKGRRVQGKMVDATITEARITTVNGVTVVDDGIITNGTIQGASTFGTVMNATLNGATISSTNHCFSSGTVGSRGQLNWKEVVK